jgi:hypothetical protein
VVKDDPMFARLCVLCLTFLIGLALACDTILLALGLQPPAGITALAGILVGALVALAGPRATNGVRPPTPHHPPDATGPTEPGNELQARS